MTEDLFVETPRGMIFARVWGGRERCHALAPIILFHDSLGSVELWRDFPGMLAITADRAVVAYDRLGFGKSDPQSAPLDLGFVDDEARSSLPALRAALGLDRMIVFGHSVGGAMAVVAAAHYVAETMAVITESAQVFVEDRTVAAVTQARESFQAPGQIDRLARYHGEKAAWVLNAWTETWLAPEFAGFSLDRHLRDVRCPLLAMHGDRDEYGSRAHPDRIEALASTTTHVVILEDCGHVPHREKPELVLRAVSAFLDAIPLSS